MPGSDTRHQGLQHVICHSTTYINLVIASGATMSESQELARQRTPALTIGIYGRSEDRRLQYLMDVHAQAVGGVQPAYLQEHVGEGTQPIRHVR